MKASLFVHVWNLKLKLLLVSLLVINFRYFILVAFCMEHNKAFAFIILLI